MGGNRVENGGLGNYCQIVERSSALPDIPENSAEGFAFPYHGRVAGGGLKISCEAQNLSL